MLQTPSVQAAKGVKFGSTDAVDNRITQDKKNRSLPLKERLSQDGINLALDYSMITLGTSDNLPGTDDNAAGGMFRFYGSWDLAGDDSSNTGSFVWKVEYRHSYSDLEPRFLEFNVGGLGLQAPPFSDQKGRVTNLYWKQKLNNGRSTIVAGFLDATDYLDVYAVASPWTGFVNFAFSTGNSTIALPGDAALGVAGATMLSDSLFVIAGITDMESDPTNPFSDLLSESHYFKSIEFGWTSSQEQIFLDNVHVTFWDADESIFMNQAEDSGVNISASKMIGAWLPFVRASWAENGSTLGIDKSLSTGFAYYGLGGEGNTLGAALNWADTATEDQYTLEVFYLLKLFGSVELSPDIQVIKNPANNPDENLAMIYGLRARVFW
ncbi:carbohydrate porin [Thalassotalea litorea]|uniref:Carbohydrate porin n=2 Tax=Thalassotalea litorea TaxID=2020715 RepID=A0A5R9IMN2_9GAMM|nr:carbohydrate porin [Thalassotalea litorea]